jgi:hypothetical protein
MRMIIIVKGKEEKPKKKMKKEKKKKRFEYNNIAKTVGAWRTRATRILAK